jgi:hypothetical protein
MDAMTSNPADAAGQHEVIMHSHHAANTFSWRPVVELSDCRFHGLVSHSALMTALAMAIPWALARKKKTIFFSLAMFFVALGTRLAQDVCIARGGRARLSSSNLHSVLGWAFAAIACCSSALGNMRGGLQPDIVSAAQSLSRQVAHAVFGVEFGLLEWAAVLTTASAALVLLSGWWATLDCFSSPKFTGYEIGHLIPASLWILGATVALLHRGKPLAVQRQEAKLMLAGGAFFLSEISIAHHGGMFRRGGTHHDQQHTMSGILWMCCGTLAGALASSGITTGVHILVSSSGHALMILYHVQFSELSALSHQVHGALLLVAGLMRMAGRLVEYALFTCLASTMFIMSSECPVRWAEDVHVNPSAYVLSAIAMGTLLWTWVMRLLFVDSAPEPRISANATAEKADHHPHV